MGQVQGGAVQLRGVLHAAAFNDGPALRQRQQRLLIVRLIVDHRDNMLPVVNLMLRQAQRGLADRHGLLPAAQVHGLIEQESGLRVLRIRHARLAGHLMLQREQKRVHLSLAAAVPGKGNVPIEGGRKHLGPNALAAQAIITLHANGFSLEAHLRRLRRMGSGQDAEAAEGAERRQERAIQRKVQLGSLLHPVDQLQVHAAVHGRIAYHAGEQISGRLRNGAVRPGKCQIHVGLSRQNERPVGRPPMRPARG